MADIMIDCSMCKEETKHMELDWFPVRDPRRFKCYNCGEYNMQKTIADAQKKVQEFQKKIAEQ